MSLLLPDHLREKITRHYRRHHHQWLTGHQSWPIVWNLGSPTEAYVQQHFKLFSEWIDAWQSWQGAGELSWFEVQWRSLGRQRLPDKLYLNNANEASIWAGEKVCWERAAERYNDLCGAWPILESSLPKHFNVLADYADDDILRLKKLVEWILAHPHSNLYPRQLPVEGLDSKWLEKRKELITDFIAVIKQHSSNDTNFYVTCGLKPLPMLLRIRLLDPTFRANAGGLEDITAPIDNIANLPINPAFVYIIENLQTGLAFNDLSGAVAIIGLGYHVDLLAKLPWLANAKCYYWGDIDTHGFAILNRARSYLPQLESLLMDETTLLANQTMWVIESKPHTAMQLCMLTEPEQNLYSKLKQQYWGHNIRLEQEKISWDLAWQKIICGLILKLQNIM